MHTYNKCTIEQLQKANCDWDNFYSSFCLFCCSLVRKSWLLCQNSSWILSIQSCIPCWPILSWVSENMLPSRSLLSCPGASFRCGHWIIPNQELFCGLCEPEQFVPQICGQKVSTSHLLSPCLLQFYSMLLPFTWKYFNVGVWENCVKNACNGRGKNARKLYHACILPVSKPHFEIVQRPSCGKTASNDRGKTSI